MKTTYTKVIAYLAKEPYATIESVELVSSLYHVAVVDVIKDIDHERKVHNAKD